MMKKYLAEGMVPVLLELKRLLEARRSPLLGDLLATLRALLKEHRSEVLGTLLVHSACSTVQCGEKAHSSTIPSVCLPACNPL
jgi:hypothetical protein